MSKGLLLCAPEPRSLLEFKAIAVINIFLKHQLASQGFAAFDLWSANVEIDVRHELKKIDAALHKEAGLRAEMRWAPLALVRVVRRYLHYLQYKKRLHVWLNSNPVDTLCLSSRKDMDLVAAAHAVCSTRGVLLEVEDGEFEEYSGLDPYMFPEDIPFISRLDSLASGVLGLCARLAGIKLLYEPYSNIPSGNTDAVPFKWWSSVALFSGLYDRLIVRISRSKNIETPFDRSAGTDPLHRRFVDASHWPEFSEDELIAINSGLWGFFNKYTNDDIDRVFSALRKYFIGSRILRLIVLDSQLAHCRLLVFAARNCGVAVDYLPHGLVYEANTTTTTSPFSAERVLAWNMASAARYGANGCDATPISHPRLSNGAAVKLQGAREPKLSKRFLILLPSPESLQLDTLERDLLDVVDAIKVLGGEAHFKLHNANPAIAKVRDLAISKVNALLQEKLCMVDHREDTLKLMERYDMIIICRTSSAIYEAATRTAPFVVYKGEIDQVGGLDGVHIPFADSVNSLVEAIESFDMKLFARECDKLRASFSLGPSPFDLIHLGCEN